MSPESILPLAVGLWAVLIVVGLAFHLITLKEDQS